MFGANFSKIITEYAKNTGRTLELEARFGQYRISKTIQTFHSNVAWPHFDHLNRILASQFNVIVERSTDYMYPNKVRKRVIIPTDVTQKETVIWQIKREVFKLENTDYGVRLALNIEEPIEFNPIEAAESVREKTRYSYIIDNGMV